MANNENSALDVKRAAQIAASYLQDLNPKAENVRVEEVEISDDNSILTVTLGYYLAEEVEKKHFLDTLARPQRLYRVFKVDRSTGEVRSMKIREPIHAG